ncbi:hypothetical protein [Herbaspirillum robiniae]|uniref:Uncharacterized protein n=1 Tax=Herbaspirillum robiniae TaxID=2014887 RepID=A0ABX2LTV2_9BURK|nr:hypothetical protein [Herbaspirillum robiniae]NUU01879.1 hypothetical protein [Herbaspirillum robiniae]
MSRLDKNKESIIGVKLCVCRMAHLLSRAAIKSEKETVMSGAIVFALEMGVVAIIAIAVYMVVKK